MPKFLLALFAVFSLSAGTSFAAESVSDLARNQAIKQALIEKMQERIARHEGMTKAEILADLESGVAMKEQKMANGADLREQFADLAMLEKEDIIALERSSLQSVMTSANYLFICTRFMFTFGGFSNPAVPIAFLMDVILLPVEIFVSIGSTISELVNESGEHVDSGNRVFTQ